MHLQIMKQYMKRFLVVFFAALIINCGGNNGSSDRATSPEEVSMDTSNGGIANGATNVSRTPSIVLSFNTPMNPSTINSSSILLQTYLPINSSNKLLNNNSLKVSLSNFTANESNDIFSFSPSAPLSPNTKYYVIITNLAQTESGQSVSGQFYFTTGNVITPMVSIINPNNAATNVSLIPSIQVKFSSAVSNVNSSTITVHAGSAGGSLIPLGSITNGSDNTYTLSFESQLSGNTNYYMVFSSEITDNIGNPLTQTTFNFTTGNFNYPTANIINPSNNAIGVSLNPTIKILFSESVNNVNSNTVSLHALSSSGTVIPITAITESNNIYTFTPESKLNTNTVYYVVLESQITNSLGYYLPQTIFNFTTAIPNNFLLVGDNGIIGSLSESHQLTNLSLPNTYFLDTASGNGVTVLIAEKGLIMASTDGINWTIESSPTKNNLNSVSFLHGKFFITGYNSTILSSVNGINWVAESAPGNCPDFSGITYKNDMYYLIGSNGGYSCLYKSSGNGTWNSESIGFYGKVFYGIAANSESLVIVGLDWQNNWHGIIYSSANGESWVSEATTNYLLRDVTYANNTFIAVGQSSQIYYSSDITTWTQATTPMLGDLWRVTYLESKFYTVGDQQLLTSTDGAEWESQYSGIAENASIRGITYIDNNYVIVGRNNDNGGYIYHSPDAYTWTQESIGVTPNQLQSIAYGNNKYVAVSYNNTIVTSNNGSSWVLTNLTGLPQYSDLISINFSNGYFVAVGDYYDPDLDLTLGLVARSEDGLSWSYESISDTTFYNVTNGNGKFIAVGESMEDGNEAGPGKIYFSESGINWDLAYVTPESLPYPNTPINAVTYGENKFVAVGVNYGDGSMSVAFVSNDGINWSTESMPYTNYLSGVTYGQNIFVAVGDISSIFTSPDGISWTQHSASFEDNGFINVSYGIDQFVIVGYNGVILTSNNGITWNQTPTSNGLSYFGILPY